MTGCLQKRIPSVWPACLAAFLGLAFCALGLQAQSKADPLPSWNEGLAKQAILDFVARTTSPGRADFLPVSARIAVFDNDGTLWTEQPAYTQFAFVIDRIKTLAPRHPEWKTTQPFEAVLEGDLKTLAATGEKGMVQLTMATHAGMTTDEFSSIVDSWIRTAQHPRFHRPYTECVYQPMLEVLSYLRANDFKTYIVSGGGADFIRPWAEKVYGVPPEQVIGSSIKTKLVMREGRPALIRLPEVNFVNDKEGKPVGINQYIGKRPIAAFGNSDGDRQMLEWTAAGPGARLLVIIHHTDAEREYAYDRNSQVGTLDKALDEGITKGWIVVDMKRDWKTVFPANGSSNTGGNHSPR